MKLPLFIRWGSSAVRTVEEKVEATDDLRRLLHSAELDARFGHMACEVDLWPVRPRSDQPLMVQFLVGHPTVSRMLVHMDGQAFIVRTAPTCIVSSDLPYERSSGVGLAEAATLSVRPSEIFDLLCFLCCQQRMPEGTLLVEQEMD
ncbi:hypothetical protein ACFY36_20120 [Actinoplanes sp. NPDC000266]